MAECFHDYVPVEGVPTCIRCGDQLVRRREAEGNVADYEAIHWQSDWNGDEVGWDHINVVGLYDLTDKTGKVTTAYINAENGDLLETIWDDIEGDLAD